MNTERISKRAAGKGIVDGSAKLKERGAARVYAGRIRERGDATRPSQRSAYGCVSYQTAVNDSKNKAANRLECRFRSEAKRQALYAHTQNDPLTKADSLSEDKSNV